METGWLLDDGQLCLGACRDGFTMLPYHDVNAIRFARREDALRMRFVLGAIGMPATASRVSAIEHAWCADMDPSAYDA